MKKIQIPLSEKLSIFVEKGIDDFSKEIIVYIGTKEGRWNQDIVSISPEYDLLKNKISWREDKVNVKIWSDSEDEDYTDSFSINVLEEK